MEVGYVEVAFSITRGKTGQERVMQSIVLQVVYSQRYWKPLRIPSKVRTPHLVAIACWDLWNRMQRRLPAFLSKHYAGFVIEHA